MEIIFSPAKESSSAEKISSPGMSCKNWVQTEKIKYTAYRNTFLKALLQSQPAQSPQKAQENSSQSSSECTRRRSLNDHP